jgi:multiple sugar transport system permease protein
MKSASSAARHRIEWEGRFTVIAVALVASILPLVWTVLAAIGVHPTNSASPPSWVVDPTLDHLAEVSVVEPAFWQELATSVGVSAVAAVLAATIAFPAAYGLARSGRRLGPRLAPVMLVLAFLPVMAYVLPLADLLRRLGLLDTLPGIVVAEAAVTAPFAVFVFHGSLAGASRDTEEAARIDGAGLMPLLLRVVVPGAWPIIVATLLVLFVFDWNQLLIPLVITGINVRTLPVILTDFFTLEREVDWPTAAAALTISVIPLLVIVVIFQRALARFRLSDGTPD